MMVVQSMDNRINTLSGECTQLKSSHLHISKIEISEEVPQEFYICITFCENVHFVKCFVLVLYYVRNKEKMMSTIGIWQPRRKIIFSSLETIKLKNKSKHSWIFIFQIMHVGAFSCKQFAWSFGNGTWTKHRIWFWSRWGIMLSSTNE